MGKNDYREKIDYEMTNEEYRIELQKIFENITDNRKLRFYYVYVSGLEKDD